MSAAERENPWQPDESILQAGINSLAANESCIHCGECAVDLLLHTTMD
jgi:hypothetical protein